jgi:hypothetical protein
MSYEQIEEIQSRKGEKIAMFLTIENAMGLMLAAFPAYLLSVAFPFVLRVLIIGAAALLGVVATVDLGGLPFYERVAWMVRGSIRQRTQGRKITPERLVGTAATARHDRPLLVGGPIRLARRDPQHLGRLVRSRSVRPTATTVRERPATASASRRASDVVAPHTPDAGSGDSFLDALLAAHARQEKQEGRDADL